MSEKVVSLHPERSQCANDILNFMRGDGSNANRAILVYSREDGGVGCFVPEGMPVTDAVGWLEVAKYLLLSQSIKG